MREKTGIQLLAENYWDVSRVIKAVGAMSREPGGDVQRPAPLTRSDQITQDLFKQEVGACSVLRIALKLNPFVKLSKTCRTFWHACEGPQSSRSSSGRMAN